MSAFLIQDTPLEDIAAAIRAKEGTSSGIQVSNFSSEIASIQSGSDPIIVEGDFPQYSYGIFSCLNPYPAFYYNNDYYIVGYNGLYKYNISTKKFENVLLISSPQSRRSSGAMYYDSTSQEYFFVYWPYESSQNIHWIRLSNLTHGTFATTDIDSSINHRACLMKHPLTGDIWFYAGGTTTDDYRGKIIIRVVNDTVDGSMEIIDLNVRPSGAGSYNTPCTGCIGDASVDYEMRIISGNSLLILPYKSWVDEYGSPHASNISGNPLSTDYLGSYGHILMKYLSSTLLVFIATTTDWSNYDSFAYKTVIWTLDFNNGTITRLKKLGGTLRSSTIFSNGDNDICFLSGSGVYAIDSTGEITAI